jgi:hypothetical protein
LFAGQDSIKIVQHFTRNTEDITKSIQKVPIYGDFSLKPAIEFAKKYLTTTFGAQRSQKVCSIYHLLFSNISLKYLIFRL